MKWTPLDTVKLWANYIHTNLHGLPDFGVPYYRPGSPARDISLKYHGRWSVPGFRRQPQQFLRLRQPRLLQHQAGYRDGRRRGRHHPGPDAEQQDQESALGAGLHRNASRSAQRPTPIRRSGRSAPIRRAAIRSPKTSPTRAKRPTSSTSAGWKNTALGGVEVLARDRQHRQISRP